MDASWSPFAEAKPAEDETRRLKLAAGVATLGEEFECTRARENDGLSVTDEGARTGSLDEEVINSLTLWPLDGRERASFATFET